MNTGTVKLKTKRLKLRKFRMTDFFAFKKWYSIPKVNPYTLSARPNSSAACMKFILQRVFNYYFRRRHKCYFWAVTLEGKLIGFVGFNDHRNDLYFVYYIMSPAYRRKGYTEEALTEVMAYMKTQDYKAIYGSCDSRNIASYNLLEKCGFEWVKTSPDAYRYPDGTTGDRVTFRFK